ncbi:hypothetical protein TSUD_294040 [Trifolium subterraneum]|uniref:hAT-like transposase RNase-H fold domain-containing protein n=1 Tax=Trifolium subterraneum TaxID=3900 RepID=A0A2Z6N4P5_TRISU|nr:hypothetical protein TSUD_294040 [Trifolium subterraneum]
MGRKRIAQTKIVPNEVPPTQETQSTPNETQNQDAEAAVEPNIPSRNTMRNDILKVHESEKVKQMKSHAKNKSRIAITTDMLTSSNQNKGYMAVTANYIDENWILQNQIIGFIYVPAPHTAEVMCDFLVRNLMDWNIDRKLSTLTVDNCSTNDALIDHVFNKISPYRFVLNGELFHMRCCAHILNLIVKDGMQAISSSIDKIRESVRYWVATLKREESFKEKCHQLNMAYSKKLVQDCRTRWNSTYLMLASALPYEEVFKRCFSRHTEYTCLPSDEDWKMAREICDNLKLFFSATELFSGAVLDPRYKMSLLNYFFPRIHGREASQELEKVKKLFEDLIEEYKTNDNVVHASSETSASTLTMTYVPLTSASNSNDETWEQGYLDYVIETASATNVKSEFLSYLEEGILLDKEKKEIIGNFDILESAFSTSGRVLTPQRRLKEDILEALMCTQNWLRKEMQGYSMTFASFECVDEDMDDDDEKYFIPVDLRGYRGDGDKYSPADISGQGTGKLPPHIPRTVPTVSTV